jgi:seryl-tRNA synthetase
MSDTKYLIEETINALQQQRDELGLQIHLGAAEAKEEFDEAMQKLDKMSSDFEPVKDAAEESAENVLASLQLVGEELKSSFDRIKKSLK